MSYKNGMAALNLEMPDIVPRTEFSVTGHYDLVKKVTGIDGTQPGKAGEAALAMMRAWEFAINWNVLIGAGVFGKWSTSMGHAVYAHGGTDWNEHIYTPFSDEEQIFNFDLYKELGPVDIKAWTANFNKHYSDQQNYNADIVNMSGVYVTCMSGLIALFGWEWLLACAGVDPIRLGRLLTDTAHGWGTILKLWPSLTCLSL